jgi:diguanylate cyclase (GGDEF)-like protein
MRLQFKILALFLPFLVLPLLFLGWTGYADARDSAAEERLSRAATLLDQLGRRFGQRVATTRANARVIAGMDLLHHYLLIENELHRYMLEQPTLLTQLAEYQKAYPSYQEIKLLFPDGYEDTRSTLTLLPNATENEAGTEFFRMIETASEDLIDRVVRNPDDGQPVLMVSSRVRSIDPDEDRNTGEFITRGYLVITSSLDSLFEFSSQLIEGEGEKLILLDDSGHTLISTHAGSEAKGANIALANDVFQNLRGLSIGRRPMIASLDGQPHLIFGRQLSDGLYAVAAFPENLLLGEASRIGEVVVAITFASILIASGLLYIALRSLLLSPITQLRDAARELGRGNFQAPIDIDRKDELGELAESFREMGRNLRRSRDQIQYIAYHDGLTGLPNRAMTVDLLERAVRHAQRTESELALLFLDIDDFKRVNDTLGHNGGDELLRQISGRLASALRASDWLGRGSDEELQEIIGRIGGDEFIVILPNLKSEEGALTVAERVRAMIAEPFHIFGHEFHVTSSLGVSLYPRDASTVEELTQHADHAMYYTKAHGKNSYQLYSQEMDALAVEWLLIKNALHKALDNDEFSLRYQPQLDLQTGTLVGVEALLRWHNPELGHVSPTTFIPVAEETGLIVPIGEWVIREACKQNALWQSKGFGDLSISVNISSRQFSRPNFEATVASSLEESGLSGELLAIELTETCIMESEEEGSRTLAAIKSLGVQISMDDFGTGYSSLGALRKLPIDELKIDRSFVRDIVTDSDDAAIIATIIAMGRSLNLRVLAEGVEDDAQLALLRDQGCHLVQGFLMSRPLTADGLEAYAMNHPSPSSQPCGGPTTL